MPSPPCHAARPRCHPAASVLSVLLLILIIGCATSTNAPSDVDSSSPAPSASGQSAPPVQSVPTASTAPKSVTRGQQPLSNDEDSPGATASAVDSDEAADRAVSPTQKSPPPDDSQRVVQPFEGVLVRPDERVVELQSYSCLEVGYLEQIGCAPGTREHEALVVIPARPSEVHAALLLAGFEPGRPGRWLWEEPDSLHLIPPTGDAVTIRARYQRADGEVVVEDIRTWIRSDDGRQSFPGRPWTFGGSRFEENPDWMGPGEHYVADMTGSTIGLVTFGDEVIGFNEVIADQADVQEPVWVVNTDHVPPVGTEVTLIISPADTSKYGDEKPAD